MKRGEGETTAMRTKAMEENIPIWAYMLSSAAAAKAIDVGVNAWLNNRKAKTAASEGIQNTVKIYNALQSITPHQCTRRTIFKAHNGGKVLDARTHKYVSILYEDPKEPFKSIADNVQNWRIDASYARMLAQLTQQREIHLHTTAMEDGRLRDLYEADGVAMSCLYYIGETGYDMYYASFATHLPISHFDTMTRRDILTSMDRITKLLKF